jgi:fucose permease
LILPIAAAAQLGGRRYDKAGVRPPVLTGLAIAVLGLAAWAAALPQLDYVMQVPGMIITGFGLGLAISPTNTDALGRVDAAERSQASGLVQTVRQLGGTFGVAIIGAVVLGIESSGTAAGSAQSAADAITVGFAVAAAAFAVALLVGWRLLSAAALTADPAHASAGAAGDGV